MHAVELREHEVIVLEGIVVNHKTYLAHFLTLSKLFDDMGIEGKAIYIYDQTIDLPFSLT
jgi:hypothetical protein